MCNQLARQHPGLFARVVVFAHCISLLATCQGESSEGGDDGCGSRSCGNLTDIRYPFWLTGKQPESCGVFQVTCDVGGIPVLEKSYNRYYSILEISYDERSVTIRNRNLLEQTCLLPRYNVSYGLTLLTVAKGNRNLSFIYGCNASLRSPEYYRLPCANGLSNSSKFVHLGGEYDAPQESLPTGNHCKISVYPVLGFKDATSKDYRKLVNGGFRLEWTDCANCSQCASGACLCAGSISCKRIDHKIRRILIGIAIAIGSLIISSAFWIWLHLRKKRKGRLGSSWRLKSLGSESEHTTQYGTHIFSYKELDEATNGFSESEELGDGGFGTVYKGHLRDGRVVAVKRLYGSNYKRLEQFMNEVDILSGLRHRNLVTLYGCTSRHSRDLLLVYEFVPNGTVADHLYGPRRSSGSLTWPVRLSISIETADALSYLHAVEPQIIHRDVKTNNILLDEGFHVKVADFGLSRLFPANATHVSTAPQGTPGYVDPEYHRCYQLTDKSDVYSFGVVLAELISSKPAVDVTRQLSEINLANLVIDKFQKQELDQLVDPALDYESRPEIKEMIDSVAELALRCLQTERSMRPAIKEVAEVLRDIESGAFRKEKRTVEADHEVAVVVREDAEARFLKSEPPYSPTSVTQRWTSTPTASSASV